MGDSKPPSRERYEKENPTVAFRISREAKEKFDSMFEGLETTKKDWFENVIDEDSKKFSSIFRQGVTKGKKHGAETVCEEFLVEVPCQECGEPVPVDSEERREELVEAIGAGVEVDLEHRDCR